MNFLNDMNIWIILACFLVTLFGGFTKGVTGFALPMIMVAGMSNFIDPKLAIASIVIPTFVGNLWQALQNGLMPAVRDFWKHRLLILTTLITIYIHTQWINILNFQVLMTILGFSIMVLSLVQLLGVRLSIPEKWARIAAFITGNIAGFFGAIAGTWGPPTVMYLLAINTPKAEQVRVSGISFGLGALIFWLGHQSSGLMTAESLKISFFLLLPMFIGLWLGAQARDTINQERFRQIVLWVLLISSLNILRKAFGF